MARIPYTDPMILDPREEKLPAWAKAALSRLRSSVISEQNRANEARLENGPEDTDTLIGYYDREGVPVRLPKGERVRLITGPGRDDHVDVHVEHGSEKFGRPTYVEIMGGNGLVVRPQSSNVLLVRAERD